VAPRVWRSASTEAAAPEQLAAPGTVLGKILRTNNDGWSVLEARDGAQMTAGPGQLLEFESGHEGFIAWARPPLYFVQTLPGADGQLPVLNEESEAKLALVGTNLTVKVGASKLGRTFNYLDEPLDGQGPAAEDARKLQVFNPEPPKQASESLTRGLATGLTCVDTLTPIGKGQTMLVAGPGGVGRQDLALDVVQAQASKGVRCVWACLSGQAAQVRAGLEARGAEAVANTALVEAPADAPATSKFATAAAALSVAEGFRNEGKDALVVLDDLSPLAKFWDATTLELLDVYGADRADMGGDSEMRGFYSSLLQRNAQLRQSYGGGSTTSLVLLDEDALKDQASPGGERAAAAPASEVVHEVDAFEGPFYSNKTRARLALLREKDIAVTDAILDKLGIPRPSTDARTEMLATMHVDQLISLVDGHIMLAPALLALGVTPPLDPANSLTRIGVGTAATRNKILASVHSPAIKNVANRLRLELASTMTDLKFSAGSQQEVDTTVHRALGWQAALKQPLASPMRLGAQVARLALVGAGLLDETAGGALTRAQGDRGAALASLAEVLDNFSAQVEASNPELFEAIESANDVALQVKIDLLALAKNFIGGLKTGK